MQLEEYCKLKGISVYEFSERLGWNRMTAHHYVSRKRRPPLTAIADIAIETGGAVRFDDWLEHFRGEKVNGNADAS